MMITLDADYLSSFKYQDNKSAKRYTTAICIFYMLHYDTKSNILTAAYYHS